MTSLAFLAVAAAIGGFPSPDGQWSLAFSRHNGYGRLDLTQRSTGRVFRMYRSNDGCCQNITWVAPHLLVFADDYNVKTLDPATKKVRRIAGFSDFVVSHDGRLVAGWADSGGHGAEAVYVVPIGGGKCRLVPKPKAQDDTFPRFSRDDRSITVLRRTYDKKTDSWSRGREVTIVLSALRPAPAC